MTIFLEELMKKFFIINILLLNIIALDACTKKDSSIKSCEDSTYEYSVTSYSDSPSAASTINANIQPSTNEKVDIHDLEKSVSFTEKDLPVFSDDPTINHKYYECIVTLESTGYLPDGTFIYGVDSQYYNDYKEISYSNKISVYDINGDECNELLIKIGGTGINDNILYVFSYNNIDEKFELLFQIPARETLFENNIVKIDDYNLQFKQYFKNFCPYTILIINSTGISNFAHVEQLFFTEGNDIPNFPYDYDLNKNHVIYEIMYTDNSSFEYLDDEDYYEWEKKYFSKPKNILFYSIA